jgi:glycosyltransferase involved in cell wall biosynthesis
MIGDVSLRSTWQGARRKMHFAYLYSRYPVVSQTFCDTEMLAVERRGWSFEIGSVHPPLTSLRHGHAARLQAPIQYAPPQEILKIWERRAKEAGTWPVALVARHEQRYGAEAKPALRARNALYFADLFARHGVDHLHVHFANRAAHTALFVKAISGLPFSITAHGQDFMVDLGSVGLLREICAEAEFVAAETDFSTGLLRERCPESAAKIHRVYNGMDLANFPALAIASRPPNESIRLLSVGRLVPFKGFACLIDACAEIVRRGCDFRCEIVGEGPLREALANQIERLQLKERVSLPGPLPQEEVFSKLRECEIFALPSVIDPSGASDIFPTVILEAMASGRPVVSTRIAGIPESVVNGETGFLVPPAEPFALAEALERLIRSASLREQFGLAGRHRVEANFRVETTVAPLEKLLLGCSLGKKSNDRALEISKPKQIAYLIDRWPDADLPGLEWEIEQILQHNISVCPIVCHFSSPGGLGPVAAQTALTMKFLPDAMVLEAEWQQERALARELEAEHTSSLQRVPAALFLEQARYALSLRKMLARENIFHLHATSSRALVCGLLLKNLLRLSLSVAIEARPALPRTALKEAIRQCCGGRTSDPRLVRQARHSFMIDQPPNFFARVFPSNLTKRMRLDQRDQFWQEWSQRLLRWSVADR